MRSRIAILVASLGVFLFKGLAADPAASLLKEKPKQTRLFTGKTMEHWKTSQPEGWSIVDGALVPSEQYRKNNYIWTKKVYDDFIFTAHYKLSKDANSGVFFRTDPENPVQGGFEIQLLDGESKNEPDGQPSKLSNGAFYGAVAPAEYANNPTGEWNALLLYVRGPRVVVFVNGKKMAEADLDRWTTPGRNPDGSKNKFKTALGALPRRGNIGLQYHGQPVAFRNIRVTELTEESPDLTRISPRPSTSEADLRYWLENMAWDHGYSDAEIAATTGMSVVDVGQERRRLGIVPEAKPKLEKGGTLRVMPFPGGRPTRIGFLDGAIDPQRETKLSAFLPWEPESYVVLDVPEAIFSNLGLAYLAHTHVPTMWTSQGVPLEPLEWERRVDGSFTMERTLPNGIAYRAWAKPQDGALRMRIELFNGTPDLLTGLRVQNCVMLRGAPEFARLTVENRARRAPYSAVSNPDGSRWVVTAWEPFLRHGGNDLCPCLHSDPIFPDCPPGETVSIAGVLAFHEGDDIDNAFARLDALDWR